MKAYKVFRRVNGKLLSAVAGSHQWRSLKARTYSEKRPTTPLKGCGPMACFSKLSSAMGFHENSTALYYAAMEIWEVEVEEAEPQYFDNWSRLIYLWQDDAANNGMPGCNLPGDTVLASRVKLVRRLARSEEKSCRIEWDIDVIERSHLT